MRMFQPSATKLSRYEKKNFLLKLLKCETCEKEFSFSKDREEHAKSR